LVHRRNIGEEIMTPSEAYQRVEAVVGLPLPKQAVCVRLAAEAVVARWREWCQQRAAPDLSGELLDTFNRWLNGAATDFELDRIAKRFLETLPQDLRQEEDPTSGYAGWALLEVAVVALGQGEEVHHSIVHSAICYAAAAHCRVQIGPTEISWLRLSPAELEFLDQWWRRCCERMPDLVVGATPGGAAAAREHP
jgi:hypothetical protein